MHRRHAAWVNPAQQLLAPSVAEFYGVVRAAIGLASEHRAFVLKAEQPRTNPSRVLQAHGLRVHAHETASCGGEHRERAPCSLEDDGRVEESSAAPERMKDLLRVLRSERAFSRAGEKATRTVVKGNREELLLGFACQSRFVARREKAWRN